MDQSWSLIPKSICCSQSVGKKQITKHASDLKSKCSVSSVTPHWNSRAMGYKKPGQTSTWLAKCSRSGGSAQHQGYGIQEHRGWHQLLLFLGSWVSVASMVGLPLTAAGSWWKSCCFLWRGAAPHGQGLSCLQSRVKQLREAGTFLHPSTLLVLGLPVLVLQKGGNCWLLTHTYSSLMYFSFQMYVFHKS